MPPFPSHARHLNLGTNFATVVTFICDTAYTSPTAPLVTVNSIGGYSPLLPTAAFPACPDKPSRARVVTVAGPSR